MSPSARYAVALGLALAGAGAWIWRARQRAEADRVEIVTLETSANFACDDLASDLEHVASALEHPSGPGGESLDELMFSIAPDGGLVAAPHLTALWYSGFSACTTARALSPADRESERHTLHEALEKARYQKGPALAATLRGSEAQVKRLRALPFRRAP